MQDAQHQDDPPGEQIQLQRRPGMPDQRIGQDGRRGDGQLEHGPVQCGDRPKPPVADHQDDEKESGSQAQQDAGRISSAVFQHAGDQYNTEQRQQDKGDLPQIQLFPQYNGSDEDHHRRGQIVAKAGDGNGGLHIGGKEKDPVQAQADAGEDQRRQGFANGFPVRPLAAETLIQKDKQGADDTAEKRGQLAGRLYMPQEHPHRAVQDHGGDEFYPLSSWFHVVLPPWLRVAPGAEERKSDL